MFVDQEMKSMMMDSHQATSGQNPEFPNLPALPCGSEEWKYAMRREAQEIVPGLYLGPYSSASKSKLEHLKSTGITHIVCVSHTLESHFIRPNFPDSFQYLVLHIADKRCENIIKYFTTVKDFVDEAFSAGGKVLVHGNAGISRSAALVMAYIMQKFGLTAKQAYKVVQSRRFCVNPNLGFMAQLEEFEPIYQAQRMNLNQEQLPDGSNRNKRSRDHCDS